VDLSLSVAYCAKTLHSIVDNLNATQQGSWKEILITTDTHHIIWQKLTDDVFLLLTLTKDQGNLGMARLQMDQLVKKLIGALT
jgi:predicted regulator of Ras-like GTPase activity (Roadblock/LC7/MglB family)